MAIFESSSQTKVRIDDTERLECALENAQNVNKHTVSISLSERKSQLIIALKFFLYFRSIYCGYNAGQIKRTDGLFPVDTETSRRYTSLFSMRTLICRFHLKNLLETCNRLSWLNDKSLYRFVTN